MKVADETVKAIKAATSQLIHKVGGAESAALVCRASLQVLYEYTSLHRLDRVIPVDVAVQLEAFLGEPVVTATIARLQGYTLARPEAGSACDIGHAVGLVARSAGAAAATLLDAQADNRIDASERATLVEQLQTVRDAADAALAGLTAPALRSVA